jgi:hypothetical protein
MNILVSFKNNCWLLCKKNFQNASSIFPCPYVYMNLNRFLCNFILGSSTTKCWSILSLKIGQQWRTQQFTSTWRQMLISACPIFIRVKTASNKSYWYNGNTTLCPAHICALVVQVSRKLCLEAITARHRSVTLCICFPIHLHRVFQKELYNFES